MTILETVTLLLAIYGAFLSSFTLFDRFSRLKIKFNFNIFTTERREMFHVISINVINKGKEEIFVKRFGLRLDDSEIDVPLVPEQLVLSVDSMDYNMKNKNIVRLNEHKPLLMRNNINLLPGQSMEEYFVTDQIINEKDFGNAKSLVSYVETKDGRIFKSKLSIERIKSMSVKHEF